MVIKSFALDNIIAPRVVNNKNIINSVNRIPEHLIYSKDKGIHKVQHKLIIRRKHVVKWLTSKLPRKAIVDS